MSTMKVPSESCFDLCRVPVLNDPADRAWGLMLPGILTLYGGFLAMLTVTFGAVALNSRMDRLQEAGICTHLPVDSIEPFRH
jgi:hypothetical protein